MKYRNRNASMRSGVLQLRLCRCFQLSNLRNGFVPASLSGRRLSQATRVKPRFGVALRGMLQAPSAAGEMRRPSRRVQAKGKGGSLLRAPP